MSRGEVDEVTRRVHVGAVCTLLVIFPLAGVLAGWRWAPLTLFVLFWVGAVVSTWWANRAKR